MKKLKLQVETLCVERFETHLDSPVARGTVRGFNSDGLGPSAPCKYCVPMPDTYSCYPGECA